MYKSIMSVHTRRSNLRLQSCDLVIPVLCWQKYSPKFSLYQQLNSVILANVKDKSRRSSEATYQIDMEF